MFIREMSIAEFQEFSDTHMIGNFHESINYALLKAEEGYEYEFICYESDEIKAAALILYKKIGSYYYGYAPRGFLMDYSNNFILEDFTKKIKEYYKARNFAFIKINPEIAISELNKKTMNFEYNSNYQVIDNLIKCGYNKLKNNMNFEALLPRVNAIINLSNLKFDNFSKNTKNKIRKGMRKGLKLELVDKNKLNIFYEFIKNKTNKDEYYYNTLYNVFSKNNEIDLFLVKIDYKEFLINSQNYYNFELEKNNKLNEQIMANPNSNTLNKKMESDKALLVYKNDIAVASKYLNTNEETFVAGALVIKYKNRITFQVTGFDETYSKYAPNYFLYYAILNYYKNTHKYADLNGLTADLSKESYYYGLNRFKLGFNPNVYEYIGEFDLVINESAYNTLLRNGSLAKEFNKTN